MTKLWFGNQAWVYHPASLAGGLIKAADSSVPSWVALAVDRNPHSSSEHAHQHLS